MLRPAGEEIGHQCLPPSWQMRLQRHVRGCVEGGDDHNVRRTAAPPPSGGGHVATPGHVASPPPPSTCLLGGKKIPWNLFEVVPQQV